MAKLGQDLAAIEAEFSHVSALSSRMVTNRIQHASSDYWKAVEAYSRDEYEKAKQLVSAGLVEMKFIHKLLDAETAERELGESVFFEYADKSDSHTSIDRIDTILELVYMELISLGIDCRKADKQ